MRRNTLYMIIFVLIPVGAISVVHKDSVKAIQRNIDFNRGWEFAEVEDSAKFYGQMNDLVWKQVRLPHDWSVEHAFDSVLGDGATAYLPGGMGVYRKVFEADYHENQTTYLYFDGVYNHTEVWLNDQKLGYHPNGYSPFYFDISDQLNADGKHNELLVKVDRSRFIDSRWYPGSGVYRNVELIQVMDLHIPIWGTFVTTPKVTTEEADVDIEVKVKNNYNLNKNLVLTTIILDQNRNKVAAVKSALEVEAGSEHKLVQSTTINDPDIWDIDDPNIYFAVTSIAQNGREIDRYETRFGIRTFRFDKDKGFFLNGKNRLIKGVCLHHDGGLVGAAVPKGVWKRRFKKLKNAGCNAIRVAHNPASEEFLDLCDEMGFLVQEEFFDEWDNPKDKRLNQQERHSDYISRGYAEDFQEWAESDLKSTMLRSRNHPSIFQWSIGNEIEWTYPRYSHSSGFFNMSWDGNYFWEVPPISTDEIKERYDEYGNQGYVLAQTAEKLAAWTKEMDTTRAVVANCILPSVSHESGYAEVLDVVGYSYRRVMYDYGHENYPDKVIMGTENLPQWHEWKSVLERDHISGTFLWTGIDYMGEAHNGWPRKGIASGLLDIAGFEKPSFHMFKSLWNDEPHVYIATQTLIESIFTIDESTGMVVEKVPGAWEKRLWTWHDVNEHWNYQEGETIIVEVYSNCKEVELYLNGKSLGIRKLSDAVDRMLKWAVPYTDGELKAVGRSEGRAATTTVRTSKDPVSIMLTADTDMLVSDGYDVTHVVAQLVDVNGNPVRHIEKNISFNVQGDSRILGVDNGAIDNVQDFQSNSLVTSKGRALMIVQSNFDPDDLVISATSENLKSNILKLKVE